MSERDESQGGAPAGPDTGGDEYGVGRLLALCDGVFAIAMTLLVLDIAVPVVGSMNTNGDAVRAFGDAGTSLGIFAFSFAMVAIYWMSHHQAMRQLRQAPVRILSRNLLFLLLVCVIPFSTSFFQRFEGTTPGDLVYLGNLLLLGLVSIATLPWRDRLQLAMHSARSRRHVAGVLVDQFGALPVFAFGLLLSPWFPEVAPLAVLALMIAEGGMQRVLLAGFRDQV